MFLLKFVCVRPGFTSSTSMPSFASSARSASLKPCTANLLAEQLLGACGGHDLRALSGGFQGEGAADALRGARDQDTTPGDAAALSHDWLSCVRSPILCAEMGNVSKMERVRSVEKMRGDCG